MPFRKGDKKPAGSGIKKGQRHKTTIWLQEHLADVGFHWSQELKRAYTENDYQKIELLQQLIPYLSPKIKEKEIIVENESDGQEPQAEAANDENVLELLKAQK